jgi:hypothetical protein
MNHFSVFSLTLTAKKVGFGRVSSGHQRSLIRRNHVTFFMGYPQRRGERELIASDAENEDRVVEAQETVVGHRLGWNNASM